MFDVKNVYREEEEEDGGGGSSGRGGMYFSAIPKTIAELADWWKLVTKHRHYPLYAIFIAAENDNEVVTLIKESRAELKQISGKECCFLYFRDEDEAKKLSDWTFAEHAKFAIPFSLLLGYTDYPCIIFLKNIKSREFVPYSLKDMSHKEMLEALRELFAKFYKDKNKDLLERIVKLKKYGVLQKVVNEVLVRLNLPGLKFAKSVRQSFVE